jgi:hypothetical protein
MTEDDYFEDDRLPPWATGKSTELVIGSQLCTRDGRRFGNAVVMSTSEHPVLGPLWVIVTDVGTMMYFTTREVENGFWPPQWVMDPSRHPGVIRWKAEQEPTATRAN